MTERINLTIKDSMHDDNSKRNIK